MTTQRQPQNTYRTALEDIEISADVETAIAQMQSAGKGTDALTHEQRANYVTALCRALRLNPLTNPVQFIKLNNREVLYVTRTATDQLAAMHGLNRKTIRGPEIVDIAGMKVALCTVEVSLPNGRSETATATLKVEDPAQLYMKLETKAKRRGTLAILGLGLLAEEEAESIPGAERVDFRAPPQADPRDLGPLGVEAPRTERGRDHVREATASVGGDNPTLGEHNVAVREAVDAERQVDDVPAWQRALEALAESTPVLASYCNAVERAALPGDCVAVWMRHRADLSAVPAPDREAAWKALALRCEAVGHMKAGTAKKWLKGAIGAEDEKRAAQPAPEVQS